jgi:phosphate transport system protein
MTIHLQRDLDKVRQQVLLLGGLVKENTQQAIAYLSRQDGERRAEILDRETQINQLEVEVEEDCLKVLALHQPVATDLRFVVAVLKVTNDLERMGDQAINILSRADVIASEPPLAFSFPIDRMAVIVDEMVTGSLDCLIRQNIDLAERVVAMDDELDDLHAGNFVKLREAVIAQPSSVNVAMSYATISANLERIGDLSTNIAEDVIFMTAGDIVRHSIQ